MGLGLGRLDFLLRLKEKEENRMEEGRGVATCSLTAEKKTENDILSDPFSRNYKLVPKKNEKCVEVSNGLRME